jgi:hypothetical protein
VFGDSAKLGALSVFEREPLFLLPMLQRQAYAFAEFCRNLKRASAAVDGTRPSVPATEQDLTEIMFLPNGCQEPNIGPAVVLSKL